MAKREELFERSKRLESLDSMTIEPERDARTLRTTPGLELRSKYASQFKFGHGPAARLTIFGDDMEVSRLMTDADLELLRDKINEILAASAIPETEAA